MARRKRRKQIEQPESSFELDLAPMLALMVTLIPIMLLSTVFVRVMIIETPLPQVVQKAMEEDRKKKDREILILVNMSQQGFELKVTEDGRTKQQLKLPKKETGWDLEGLHQELVKVKKQHPKIFRLDLLPQTGIKYADIVRVMDEARNTRDGDGKIVIMDEETNKPFETDVMFPDVQFANVVEG